MVSQDMVAGAGELVEDGKKSPVGRFGNAKVTELEDGIHLLALHGIHERLKAGVGIMDDVLVDIGDDSDPEFSGVGARRANGQRKARGGGGSGDRFEEVATAYHGLKVIFKPTASGLGMVAGLAITSAPACRVQMIFSSLPRISTLATTLSVSLESMPRETMRNS